MRTNNNFKCASIYFLKIINPRPETQKLEYAIEIDENNRKGYGYGFNINYYKIWQPIENEKNKFFNLLKERYYGNKMKFKIGDKVIVKKFSEKEFEEIYKKKYSWNNWNYDDYLSCHQKYFGKTFTILKIDVDGIYWIKETDIYFYEKELELTNNQSFSINDSCLNKNYLKEENTMNEEKTMILYKIIAINTKTNEVLKNEETLIEEYTSETSKKIKNDIRDELIRANEKLKSRNLHISIHEITSWIVKKED